ncbi:hypothetical protein ACIQW9_08155 [Herminiimonas sp. NPDC097707]|uniref:hypothetical protein n=1 Tax=Herminiimonas sp. NPDC097707 TaxID=3364007 RepID=UPI00383AEB9D
MNKQILKRVMFLGAALLLAGSSLPAFAQAHGGGRVSGGMGGIHSGLSHPNGGHPSGGHPNEGWRGGGRRYGRAPIWWGVGLGIGLGWDLSYYGYPYPDYYYYPAPPAVIVDGVPVYQTAPSSTTTPANANWYYCASAQAYSPYVSQCPEGWQVVPAIPPAPAPGK